MTKADEQYIKIMAKRLEYYTEEDYHYGETPTAKHYETILKKTDRNALYIIEWLLDELDGAID